MCLSICDHILKVYQHNILQTHGQEGALAPLWKCCEVFCALVVRAKRSVGELFMHYFHNQSSASGGLTATVNPSLDPTGGLSSRPLICPPLEKNPAGAHVQTACRNLTKFKLR